MKSAKDIIRTFICIIFVLSFGLFAMGWCWFDEHKFITDIYLPAGQWNDEVFYYKQISAMIKYGIPQGYFGYNEMTASHLTFGAWSFILLIPYCIWGMMFGWNIQMPVICNLIFVTIALGIFLYLVRPNTKQILIWLVIIASMPIITRYIISGMVESVFFSAIILFVGVQIRLEKQYNRLLLAILYLLVGFLSLARPYMIIFMIVPFYILYKRNKWFASVFTLIYCIITMISYGYINTYLCAPYTSSIINTEVFDVLCKEGWMSMVVYVLKNFIEGLRQLGVLMCDALRYGGIGETYVVFCVLLIFLFVSLICEKGKERAIWFSIIALCIIISAVILFYSINAGSRHLLMFLIYGAMILIFKSSFPNLVTLSIVLWSVCLLIPKDEYIYDIPYNTDSILVNQNQKIEQELNNSLIIENKERWSNTIDWIYNEDYSICYFVPDGFGINICFENQITDEIQAKYILVKNETAIQKKYENYYYMQWKGDNYTLYCR